MTIPLAITLLGLGLLVVPSHRPDPRQEMTLKERAIEAQRISAQASQVARALTAQWLAEERGKLAASRARGT